MRSTLILILVAFSCYTAWIGWEFGYLSVFTETLDKHPSTQALLDLVIAAVLLLFVMIADNRRRGRDFKNVLPYVITTLLLGSIGPLLYFIKNVDFFSPEKER